VTRKKNQQFKNYNSKTTENTSIFKQKEINVKLPYHIYSNHTNQRYYNIINFYVVTISD